MSQIKAKQIKLSEPGALLIGGVGGTGSTISATGRNGQVLRVVNGAPAWSVNDNLTSANTFNQVVAADAQGVNLLVQNSDASAAVQLASFRSGANSDELFAFSKTAGELSIAAEGTATDIDIVIAPKGGGDVIIGAAGGGVLQADDGEDLALLGGTGAGNLYINGGGTGKVFYGNDDSDPNLEVATIGDLEAVVASAAVSQIRTEFNGDQSFVLNLGAIGASIIAFVNGLAIKDDFFTYDNNTRAVNINTFDLGYTLDAVDQVVFVYEVAA